MSYSNSQSNQRLNTHMLCEDHSNHDTKWQIRIDGECHLCLACAIHIWRDKREMEYKKRQLLCRFLDSLKTCSRYVDVLMEDEVFDEQFECPRVLLSLCETLVTLIETGNKALVDMSGQCESHSFIWV